MLTSFSILFAKYKGDLEELVRGAAALEKLKDGAKVKAYVFFRGRSILFKEQGEVLLLRFANDLEDYGKVEQMPVLEGKRMIIMLTPKKQAK